jgi:FtsP/CotA-like multicopper oxidase with cupredoxin domain
MLPYPQNERIDRDYMQQLLFSLEEHFRGTFFRNQDVVIDPKTRFILVSPNGTRYRVVVNNDGTLTTQPA